MYPGIEIKDLVLVQTIARAGGVSHAARSLHLSQSAVSHHLSRLEERLGVALFERVGRRLEIAAQGKRFVALAEEILPKIRTAEREIRSRRRRALRLATQCYTAYRWLPALTDILALHHPDIDVHIELDAIRNPRAALDDGAIDLAILHSAMNGGGFVQRTISHDELVLVMSPNHPLAVRKRLQPTDLHPHTFLVFDSGIAELRAQGELTFPNGDAPMRIQRVPLTEALIQLVCSGHGVSLLTGWIARPYLDSGELVSRRLSGANLKRCWRAVYRKKSSLRGPLRTAVDFLADHHAS